MVAFKVVNVIFRFTTHEVTGLGSAKEYEFRVFAENIFGRSSHSEISSVVKTQEVIQKKKTKKREGKQNEST